MRRIRACAALVLILAGVGGMAVRAFAQTAAADGPVIVVPIDGTVDQGMAHLVARSIDDANAQHARAVVLVINSPGGLLDAGFAIRDSLFASKAPVTAYVQKRAYSAAALIALAANRIDIAPGASIGAAEPIPSTDKMISAVRAEFESTAQRNHRDPKLAGAMVDKNVAVPGVKNDGTILTLNTQDAIRTHIADAVEPTLDAVLADEHLSDASLQHEGYTFAEELARFATDPAVSGILLTIGMLGLLIEMQTMHGIAGTVGVLAFVLFFGSHVYAGFSNALVIGLALLGVLGILFELHVLPGHGFAGIAGAAALFLAVVLSFGFPFILIALPTISSAIIATVILFVIATRLFPENQWMRRLVLTEEQGPEYVAAPNQSELLGESGIAASYLRPAGVAMLGARRVDVLTEGEFIAAGTPIRVTRVEGSRIFVEPAL